MPPTSDTVRVKVTLNPDGSRTAYEFDTAHHTATATTTSRDGKPAAKFSTSSMRPAVSRPALFTARTGSFASRAYISTTTPAGCRKRRNSTKDGAVISKIVYTYDSAGKVDRLFRLRRCRQASRAHFRTRAQSARFIQISQSRTIIEGPGDALSVGLRLGTKSGRRRA